MKLAKHIRRLILVYGHSETILRDPKVVREILAFHAVTPSLGQTTATIRKHFWFIVSSNLSVPLVAGLDR